MKTSLFEDNKRGNQKPSIENPLKMGKRTNNDLQNTTQKTQDRAIKTGVI
jgi:hypothetical protein